MAEFMIGWSAYKQSNNKRILKEDAVIHLMHPYRSGETACGILTWWTWTTEEKDNATEVTCKRCLKRYYSQYWVELVKLRSRLLQLPGVIDVGERWAADDRRIGVNLMFEDGTEVVFIAMDYFEDFTAQLDVDVRGTVDEGTDIPSE